MRCTLGRCPPPRWIPGEWGQVGPCLSLTSSTTVWRLILLACLKDKVSIDKTPCVGEWFVSFTPGWNTGDSNQACDACECIEAVFVFVIPRVKTGLEYVIGSSNIFLAVWSLSAPQTRPLSLPGTGFWGRQRNRSFGLTLIWLSMLWKSCSTLYNTADSYCWEDAKKSCVRDSCIYKKYGLLFCRIC